MAPVKCTKFSIEWLKLPKYSEWIMFDSKNNKSAKCKYCMCSIDLSNMGKAALDSHMKSKKHQRLSSESAGTHPLNLWLEKSPEKHSQQCAGNGHASCSVQSLVEKEEVLRAEIYWTLDVVAGHRSFNSSKHSNSLFRMMFPDSNIAKSFACGADKLKYLSVFGLAPYYEQKLLGTLEEVPFYSIYFDESFNRVTKNEQMDFGVRFWDHEANQVIDHYLTSKFIGHATANDLLRCFRDATSKLKQEKIIQISMDGPNVNHKFFKDLLLERDASNIDLPCIVDLGSCGLHVVHGAFRTGFEKTGWKIDRVLRSLWYLFNESPARREDFTQITGSDIFPLQFCGTRWVEDCKVAERAVSLWQAITKYVNKISSGPKSKIPKSSSYLVVQNAVNDPLICAKLHVFITIANTMQPFLQMFQNDKPMVPFLADEISQMMKDVLERFVKKEFLSDSVTSIMKLDVEDTAKHVANKNVNIGFAAKTALETASVGVALEAEFKYQCLTCYQSIISKLKQRSPLKYELVLNLRSFNPKYIINHPNGTIINFEKVLTFLINSKFLTPTECDLLVKQYNTKRLFQSLMYGQHVD